MGGCRFIVDNFPNPQAVVHMGWPRPKMTEKPVAFCVNGGTPVPPHPYFRGTPIQSCNLKQSPFQGISRFTRTLVLAIGGLELRKVSPPFVFSIRASG